MMTSKDKHRFDWLDKVAEDCTYPLLCDGKRHDDGYYSNGPKSNPLDGERESDIGGYGE